MPRTIHRKKAPEKSRVRTRRSDEEDRRLRQLDARRGGEKIVLSVELHIRAARAAHESRPSIGERLAHIAAKARAVEPSIQLATRRERDFARSASGRLRGGIEPDFQRIARRKFRISPRLGCVGGDQEDGKDGKD